MYKILGSWIYMDSSYGQLDIKNQLDIFFLQNIIRLRDIFRTPGTLGINVYLVMDLMEGKEQNTFFTPCDNDAIQCKTIDYDYTMIKQTI